MFSVLKDAIEVVVEHLKQGMYFVSFQGYHITWSPLVCVLIFSAAGVIYYIKLRNALLPLCIVMVILFFVMLACMFEILWALGQRSPVQTKAHLSPVKKKKKRIIVNVLTMLVTAVMTYSLGMIITFSIRNVVTMDWQPFLWTAGFLKSVLKECVKSVLKECVKSILKECAKSVLKECVKSVLKE